MTRSTGPSSLRGVRQPYATARAAEADRNFLRADSTPGTRLGAPLGQHGEFGSIHVTIDLVQVHGEQGRSGGLRRARPRPLRGEGHSSRGADVAVEHDRRGSARRR